MVDFLCEENNEGIYFFGQGSDADADYPLPGSVSNGQSLVWCRIFACMDNGICKLAALRYERSLLHSDVYICQIYIQFTDIQFTAGKTIASVRPCPEAVRPFRMLPDRQTFGPLISISNHQL